MPRLLALLPKNGLALPGIRANQMSQIQLGAPGTLQDWKFHVQGPSVIFESPAGWEPGKRATGKGPRFVYSLPRADFYLQWHYEEGEDVREPVNWQDPGRAKLAEVPPEVEPKLKSEGVAAAEANAETVVAEHYTPPTPSEPEPELADPDDADDLPRAPKKGQKR